MGIVELGSFFSLDSLVAGVMLASVRPLDRDRLQIAVAFGLCDGLASSLSPLANVGLLAVPLVGICLLLISGYSGRHDERRWLLALPLGLSVDNLLQPVPLSTAILCGVGSAFSAFVGLHIGGLWKWVHDPIGRRLTG